MFWGPHLYTWSFVGAMTIVVATTVVMGFSGQYRTAVANGVGTRLVTWLLFAVAAAWLVANPVSVILECGVIPCTENPVRHRLSFRTGGNGISSAAARRPR